MKKRLIAVILVVAALSTMLGISGSAYQLYTKTYKNSSGTNLMSVYLYNYPSSLSVGADMKFWSTTTYSKYTFGVFTATFTGYRTQNPNVGWSDDYAAKSYSYNMKRFTDSDYGMIDSVGLRAYTFSTTDDVTPVTGYILYIAGNSSSVSSSTFNCRYTYYNEDTGFPSSIWFSDVSSDMYPASWIH